MSLKTMVEKSLAFDNDWTLASETSWLPTFKRFAIVKCWDAITDMSDYFLVYLPEGANSFCDDSNTKKQAFEAVEVYNVEFNENGGNPVILRQKEIDDIWPKLGEILLDKGEVPKEDQRFLIVRNIKRST
jgi:hypothetical protein